MWQSLIILLILGLSFIVFAFCQHTGKSKINAEGSIATTKDSVINNGIPMKKKEIEEKLKLLARSEAPDPKSLKMGAMCYSPTKLPPTVDYVCPICGEKTIYTLQQEYFV